LDMGKVIEVCCYNEEDEKKEIGYKKREKE
jgi:hypothetical protein